MPLRDYQTDICAQVNEAFDKHRSVMVQMPTGTGKTVVLASLVSQLDMTSVLIVAHRRELIKQIKATCFGWVDTYSVAYPFRIPGLQSVA